MRSNISNKKGFTHFEIVLLIIVVALVALSGLYILNYGKNKSKAGSEVLPGGATLIDFNNLTYNKVTTKPYVNGCKKSDGTKLWWGKLLYTGSGTRPTSPNVKFFVNDVDNLSEAKELGFDSTYNKTHDGFVTYIYHWSSPVSSFNVYMKEGGNVVKNSVSASTISDSSCGNILNNGPAHKDIAPSKKATPSTPTTVPVAAPSGSSSSAPSTPAPSSGSQSSVTDPCPRFWPNFARLFHFPNCNNGKSNANILNTEGKAIANYDVFWKDSTKQVLIVQYRVHTYPGSPLKPGNFFSNVQIYSATSSKNSKLLRVASLRVSDPVPKSEPYSPLKTGKKSEISAVKTKMKTSGALSGRYWDEVQIPRSKLKGKSIIYFSTGYDGNVDKSIKSAYTKSPRRIDINKIGWLDKVKGSDQPIIRR